MTELTLFASTFVLVFALGAQTLNVKNGHYIAAAITSLVIGGGQMVLFKLAPNASWSEIAAFLLGGPFGITASMWAHPRLAKIMKMKKVSEQKSSQKLHYRNPILYMNGVCMECGTDCMNISRRKP